MNRRGFLGAILAAAAAPAIVRADSLMRVVPRYTQILGIGDAIVRTYPLGLVANMREDQEAYNQLLSGQMSRYSDIVVIDQRGPSRLLAALTPDERARVSEGWSRILDDKTLAGWA